MTNPFEFFKLTDLQAIDSPIVHVITAEEVQEFCELNCGGQLSDEELSALVYAFAEAGTKLDFLSEAISIIRPHLRPDRECIGHKTALKVAE